MSPAKMFQLRSTHSRGSHELSTNGIETIFGDRPCDVVGDFERVLPRQLRYRTPNVAHLDAQSIPVSCHLVQAAHIDLPVSRNDSMSR